MAKKTEETSETRPVELSSQDLQIIVDSLGTAAVPVAQAHVAVELYNRLKLIQMGFTVGGKDAAEPADKS